VSAIASAVRKRCHFQCCLCKSIGVEIHHIIPQADGGPDSAQNAAPLCPSCHETYGANPTKRKFIREARDFWYEVCAKRYAADPSLLIEIKSTLANAASKHDIEGLRSELLDAVRAFGNAPHTILLPLRKPSPGSRRRLGIRDLLVLVHATSTDRPPFQIEILCMRELWPVGKDDWRGIYKHFLRRFGERTLHHLASRALNAENVRVSDTIAEDDLGKALRVMHIEATCMVLVDQGSIGAMLGESGEILWTGAEVHE